MEKLSDAQINKIWAIISSNHAKHLRDKGVLLPNLKNKQGMYTKDALALVALAYGYPKTKVLSKAELTSFIKHYYPDVGDVQQGRHLGMQKGWNIVSGQRGDAASIKHNVPAGSYKLIDLTTKHPAFIGERREGFKGGWNELKAEYGNRCACCGAKEGDKHWLRNDVIVELQKGHMDPNLALEEGNIIPQCQICNRADRNRWIYDKTGRVIEIADSEDGFRIVNRFIKRVSKTHKKSEILKKIFD